MDLTARVVDATPPSPRPSRSLPDDVVVVQRRGFDHGRALAARQRAKQSRENTAPRAAAAARRRRVFTRRRGVDAARGPPRGGASMTPRRRRRPALVEH
eukprot:31435-Pelagococcus_subviridis.AAC.2